MELNLVFLEYGLNDNRIWWEIKLMVKWILFSERMEWNYGFDYDNLFMFLVCKICAGGCFKVSCFLKFLVMIYSRSGQPDLISGLHLKKLPKILTFWAAFWSNKFEKSLDFKTCLGRRNFFFGPRVGQPWYTIDQSRIEIYEICDILGNFSRILSKNGPKSLWFSRMRPETIWVKTPLF
jgi:hypothetical protein